MLCIFYDASSILYSTSSSFLSNLLDFYSMEKWLVPPELKQFDASFFSATFFLPAAYPLDVDESNIGGNLWGP